MGCYRELKPISKPEQWKYYKKGYWVSDQGRVKKVFKSCQREIGYVRRDYRNNSKIMQVGIDGKLYSISVLVWTVFRGEIPNGYCVSRKNGVWNDDSLYNLELKTHNEIIARHNSEKKRQAIYCKDNGKIYSFINDCAKQTGLSIGYIRDICYGKVKNPTVQLYWYCDESGKAFRGNYKDHVRHYVN